jgi:nitroreductase
MIETIKNRRSIRKFIPDKPILPEHINVILEAAMFAPSAGNYRPWEFIVVTNGEVLRRFAKTFSYMQMFETAPAAIVVVANVEKSPRFFPQDCGAATQNIMLAAYELGFGTCWCGFYPKEDKMNLLSDMLSIDTNKVPFCVIAVGIPDEAPEARGFYEPEKVIYLT